MYVQPRQFPNPKIFIQEDGTYKLTNLHENNVHGNLKGEIIIGVDDKMFKDTQKDNLHTFKFSKTYRKMKTDASTYNLGIEDMQMPQIMVTTSNI